MKFGYTIVYVQDAAATVDLYERAFSLKRLFIRESNQYAEMDTGTTKLAFVADDVDAAFKKSIVAGAQEIKKPAQKPWGQTVGSVTDCNGFLIELCSPM
ncbi:MAG: VOC family protein [Bdellovibrio sp.]|nr:VOC family protein [Bdellovibrio sp.]